MSVHATSTLALAKRERGSVRCKFEITGRMHNPQEPCGYTRSLDSRPPEVLAEQTGVHLVIKPNASVFLQA